MRRCGTERRIYGPCLDCTVSNAMFCCNTSSRVGNIIWASPPPASKGEAGGGKGGGRADERDSDGMYKNAAKWMNRKQHLVKDAKGSTWSTDVPHEYKGDNALRSSGDFKDQTGLAKKRGVRNNKDKVRRR